MRNIVRAMWPLITWAALFFGVVATASSQSLSVRISLGFSGVVPTRGLWPVVLEISNTGAEPAAMTIDCGATSFVNYGNPTVRRSVEVSAGAKKSVTFVLSGNETYGRSIDFEFDTAYEVEFSGPAFVTFKAPIGNRASFTFDRVTFDPTTCFVVGLGGKARQLSQAAHSGAGLPAGQRLLLGDKAVRIVDLAASDIPDNWLAWSTVAAIVWTDPEPDSLGDPSQLRAIERFVEWGGTLIFASAQQPTKLSHPALAHLMPGSVTKTERVNYGQFNGTRVDGPVLHLEPSSGARLATFGFQEKKEFRRAERTFGRGKIVLLGADPFLLDLGDSSRFVDAWRFAADLPIAFGRDNDEPAVNYDMFQPDLSMGGPPWEAILINSNILRPPVGLLILLAIGFVLLIGPIDYQLLKSKGKLHWSPLTLLIYTTVFAAVCIVATFFVFAPREETNRVAILDLVDGGDGTERIFGNVYWGIYAPLGGRYVPAPQSTDRFDFVSRYAGRPDGRSGEFAIQRTPRSGFQPISAELAFNSFRCVESLVSGTPDGGFLAEVTKTGLDEWTVKIVNRFAKPLRGVVLSVGQGEYIEFGDVPAGATVEKKLVVSATRTMTGEGLDRASTLTSGRIGRGDPVSTELATCIAVQGLLRKLGAKGIGSGNLPEKTSLVVGVIDDLPFADTTKPDSRGFTFSAIRRLVDIKDN